MKKKIKKLIRKACSIFMVFGIILSSFSSIFLGKIPEAQALASINGDKIIETAMNYWGWDYDEVGSCTGFVTRVLNKLGIGETIVGIHPYNIDEPQSSGGSRYAPDAMYRNAMNHPEDAVLIWQGYKKDIEANAHLFKNGDLIIERIQDKDVYTGTGHVSFMYIHDTTISSLGAITSRGVSEIVLATNVNFNSGISLLNIPPTVNGNDFVSVFRLTTAEPEYDVVSSTKTASEKVDVSFYKTDEATGKHLSGVTVDFYRDGIKFATGTTNENGYAYAAYTTSYSASSSAKEYCTNYDELDDEGKQKVDEKGAYHYLVDAQADADVEAQQKANEMASQTHTYSVVEVSSKTHYWLDDDNKTVSDSITGSGNISVSMTNERVTGSATIEKVDNDTTTEQNEAELDGAVYGLYAKENILDPADSTIIYSAGEEVARVTIKDGKASVNNLYLGEYEWREISAGEGYQLDTASYPVSLKYADQSVKTVTSKTTVYENVITANFEIEKVITDETSDSGILEKEEGAEFIVVAQKYVDKYGSIEEAWKHREEYADKEFDYLVTDVNGYAKSKELAYGTFVIKQIKGQMDTELVKDEWTFTVSKDNQDTVKYIINNKIFTSYIRLVKKDAVTDETISLSNTTFKIINLGTGEYVTQKVGDEEFSEWTTNESGEVVLPLPLLAGNYKLIELESPDYYLTNNEGVEFTVTSSNIVETDSDGDAILTVTMYDEPVKGIINVEKQGETFVDVIQNEDGSYEFVYDTICLADAVLEVKAREDIINPATGEVIYAKGTIVDVIKTSNTCENHSIELPLGAYTVYEVEAPEGMILDTTEYDVDLTFVDSEKEIVIETVSLINERQKVETNILKQDEETLLPLAGVKFGLYAKKDITAPNSEEVLIKAGSLIETAITDENGTALFKSDLPLSFDNDTYFEIREIESLNGYYINETVFDVDTKYNKEDEAIKNNYEINNKPIKNYILINKVDSLSKENIVSKDFSFNLCKDEECNEVISNYQANTTDGTALIDIRYGTYYIKEATAPEGYSLSSEIIKVTLDDTGLYINDDLVETNDELLYSIVYQNSLLPVIQTGIDDNVTTYIAVGGVALIGIIATIISFRKKKKRN